MRAALSDPPPSATGWPSPGPWSSRPARRASSSCFIGISTSLSASSRSRAGWWGDPSPLLAAPTPRDRRAAAELLAERQCRGATRDGRHQGPPGCHPGQRGPRGQSRGPRHVLSGPAGTGLPDQRPCLSGPAWSGWQRANGGIEDRRQPGGHAAEPQLSHDVPHLDPPRDPRRVYDHDAGSSDVRLPPIRGRQRRQRRLRRVHRRESGREALLQRGPSAPPASAQLVRVSG